MKTRSLLSIAVCTLLAMPAFLHAQPIAPQARQMAHSSGEQINPGESLNAVFTQLEQEVVGAADAMPADKYNFAPPSQNGADFKGVRDFGSQVRHLAQANYHFFHGWGIPGEVDPKSLESLKTKEELMKALRDSYAFDHAAIKSITPENAFTSLGGPPERKITRVSTAAFCMAHSMDHYGQLVEYLRMNGIIPPASRKGGM